MNILGILQILSLAAVAINGIDIKYGSIHLNSERILFPIIAIVLLVSCVARPGIFLTRSTVLYLTFGLTAAISAAVSSGFNAHLNGLLITIAPIGYYLLFSQVGMSQKIRGVTLELTLWIVSVASILAFFIWFRYGLGQEFIDRGRIQLTMSEPNILGGFLVILALLNLNEFKMDFRHISLHISAAVAIALTASKVPYIAYLSGILCMLFMSGKINRLKTIIFMSFTVPTLALAVIVYRQPLLNLYAETLDRPDAIRNRMFALEFGWQRFLEHPWLGNGPLDFSLYNQSLLEFLGTIDVRNMWLWQIWVAVLHDEGLIGFTVFSTFVITSFRRAYRLNRVGFYEFAGFFCAALAEIVCCQTTTTHLSAVFGMIFGLLNGLPFRVHDERIANLARQSIEPERATTARTLGPQT